VTVSRKVLLICDTIPAPGLALLSRRDCAS